MRLFGILFRWGALPHVVRPAPADRTFIVYSQRRIFAIEAEDRTFIAAAQSRTFQA
jgi:hypothetical protein